MSDDDFLSDEEINAALEGFERDFSGIDNFEDELAGVLGDKAKSAVLVTRLSSAQLLAAFCQLSDISATCIASDKGAVALLRNRDGDGPEAAARDLTTVVSGLSLALAVNRADHIEATLWANGQKADDIAPPIMFMNAPDFVEDMMIGSTTLDALKTREDAVDSGSLDRKGALAVIAQHTRFGRAGKGGSRVS